MTNTYATTAGTTLWFAPIGTDPIGGIGTAQLAGVDEINGLPAQEADEFETTRVDQEVSGGGAHDWFKQFAPDHIDPGNIELKLAMNETQLETLYGLVRQMKAFGILFSSGGDLICDGFIKKVGPEAPKGDEVVVAVTIRLSGKPTFTKAA